MQLCSSAIPHLTYLLHRLCGDKQLTRRYPHRMCKSLNGNWMTKSRRVVGWCCASHLSRISTVMTGWKNAYGMLQECGVCMTCRNEKWRLSRIHDGICAKTQATQLRKCYRRTIPSGRKKADPRRAGAKSVRRKLAIGRVLPSPRDQSPSASGLRDRTRKRWLGGLR